MRVQKFSATSVHGYLPLEVQFFEDLTFLTGLNGCGKTTALQILMGLLTPAVDELSRIEFETASVEVEVDGEVVHIRAVKEAGGLELSVSGIAEPLNLQPAHLELLADWRRDEEGRGPIFQMLAGSPVVKWIRDLSTPMFLGLERRIYSEDRFGDSERSDIRRRETLQRRIMFENSSPVSDAANAGLLEVMLLVRDTMSEIRAEQERLDRSLRERLLVSAFKFTPQDFFYPVDPPNRDVINRYRRAQAEVERAASSLRLPVDQVQTALQDFFEKMSSLLDSMEKRVKKSAVSRKGRAEASVDGSAAVFTWIVNKSQVDKILENLSAFEQYAKERQALHGPIERLLNLINKFLAHTRKEVLVTDNDRLAVKLPDERIRGTSALSSGERQLLVMLGHLTLNKRLSGSGVFIVDEPELSLHLSWQEMFVDAVREANPSVQLIFATHSPAIILDRDEHCCSLSEDT